VIDTRVEVNVLIEENLEGRGLRKWECHKIVKSGSYENEDQAGTEITV